MTVVVLELLWRGYWESNRGLKMWRNLRWGEEMGKNQEKIDHIDIAVGGRGRCVQGDCKFWGCLDEF